MTRLGKFEICPELRWATLQLHSKLTILKIEQIIRQLEVVLSSIQPCAEGLYCARIPLPIHGYIQTTVPHSTTFRLQMQKHTVAAVKAF